MVDIAGVVVELGHGQPEIGADQGRTQLGDEFLGGVGVAAEPEVIVSIALSIALNTNEPRTSPPVTQLCSSARH